MSILPRHFELPSTIALPLRVTRPQIRAAAEAAQHEGRSICVVHLDLDRFHQVNQRWGQLLGDQVLSGVGDALLSTLPTHSLLAASDGDAFVALVPVNTYEEAREVAERLLLAVRQPVRLGELLLTIEGSAGFSHHTGHDVGSDLLEHAFLACRRAKSTMRGSAIGYESSLEPTSSSGSAPRTNCARRLPATSCACTCNPRSIFATAASSGWRPWCVGSIRRARCWVRPSSSRLPSPPG